MSPHPVFLGNKPGVSKANRLAAIVGSLLEMKTVQMTNSGHVRGLVAENQRYTEDSGYRPWTPNLVRRLPIFF